MIEYFSTWHLIRLSGFLAYFLFTFSIAAGLMGRFSIFSKKKPLFMELHQTSGWLGFLTVIFHMVLLWKDNYAPYTLKELFIPFLAKNEPILSSYGTISFYLFILSIASSDFLMKRLGRDLWKKIHLAVIPAWILMVLHGIFIGTDTAQPWATSLYAGGIVLVLLLMIFRRLESMLKPNKKQMNLSNKGSDAH